VKREETSEGEGEVGKRVSGTMTEGSGGRREIPFRDH